MSEHTALEAEVERSKELAARLREALARKMADAGSGLRRAVSERPVATIAGALAAGFALVFALRYLFRGDLEETQTTRR